MRIEEILASGGQGIQTEEERPQDRQASGSMRMGDLASLERVNIDQAPEITEVDEAQRQTWKNKGPIGFFEQANRQDKSEMIPFNPEGAVKAWQVFQAVNRLRADKYKSEDLTGKVNDTQAVNDYLKRVEEERVRGFTVGGRVAQGVAAIPGFMVEFLATGGAAAAGQRAVRVAINPAIRTIAKNQALKFSVRAIGGVTGAVYRTAVMPHRVAESAIERQIDANLEFTDKGLQIAQESREKPFISLAKGFGDMVIENFSEVTGQEIGKAGRAIAGRIIPQRMASGMATLFRKLHPNESVSKLFTQAGWNGFLEEMGEERVGNFLRAVTGVEDFGAQDPDSTLDRVVAAIPNGEQLLVEAGILAVPGATQAGIGQAVELLRGRRKASGLLEGDAAREKALSPEMGENELKTVWEAPEFAGGRESGITRAGETELLVFKNNLNDLRSGASEQAHISDLPVEIASQKKIPRAIYIDQKIIGKIESKHGLPVDDSFVDNLNNSDFMVFYKDAPKINFVKDLGDNKTLVVSAKRYNGHFVITGFESSDPAYAESLKKRGEVVNLTGRAAVPLSVPAEPSRPASLSGVSKTSTSPEKNIPQPGKRVNVKDVMPDASGVTPLQRQIQSLEDRQGRVEAAQYALDDIDTVRQGFLRRIRRYKDGNLKEELTGIPKNYITKTGGIAPDEAMQELRDRFGVDVTDETGLKEYLQNLEETRKNLLEEIRRNRPQTVTKRETTLLRERIKATEQGIREGRLKTKQEIETVQNEVIDAIEQADLPLDERAKFIRTVKNVQTRVDLAREFPEISRRLREAKNKQMRQELIAELQKAAERAGKSAGIAVEYADMINNIVGDIEFQGHRPETIESLKNTRKFIEESLAVGKDVEMPEEVLQQLKILEKTPVSGLNESDLENLLNTVDDLERMGRAKLRLRQMEEERRKQEALADLARDSKPLDYESILDPRPGVGKDLNAGEKLKNSFYKGQNVYRKLDLLKTTPDRFFDWLDGFKKYKGANYNIFKKTIDKAYSEYLKIREEATKEVRALAVKLKLTQDNFERIGVYAVDNQAGGRDKLLSMEYTEEEIDNINLNQAEMEFYLLMRDKLDMFRPYISEIMRLVYNLPFHAVKNYFPFMTDFEKMSDSEMRARFGDNVEQFGLAPRKNVSRGFTKKRIGKGGGPQLHLNAMAVFLRHVDNAAYFVTVGKETKWLGELAGTQEYQDLVGELGQQQVREYIDLVARKGKGVGEKLNFTDTIRKITGSSVLAFRLSSAMAQFSSLGHGMGFIGKYGLNGLINIATDGRWRQFVMANMPEVKNRIGDDPAFASFTLYERTGKGLLGKGKRIAGKAGELGFAALQTFDRWTSSFIAAGAYQKYCAEHGIDMDLGNPDSGALEYAQQTVRLTQSSPYFKDMAPVMRNNWGKLLLQFNSFAVNEWNMVQHDLWRAGIMEKDYGKARNIAFGLMLGRLTETGIKVYISGAITEGVMKLLFGDDDERKREEEDPALKILISLVNPDYDQDYTEEENSLGMEFLRKAWDNILPLPPMMNSFMTAFKYGSNPVPSVEFTNKFFARMGASAKSKDPEKKTRHFLRAMTLLVPGGSSAEQLLNAWLKSLESEGEW